MGEIWNTTKSVCIIGGGPAGLVSLRRVLHSPHLTGTIFEQKDDVGGVWYFNGQKQFATSPENLSKVGEGKENDLDPECHTSMYADLTANLPYKLMELQDFPSTKSDKTFLTQQELHQYYKDYATHFNLWPHIQLNTSVISVSQENPTAPDGVPGRWIVTSHNHKADTYKTSIYDAVMVCTGKNCYPYLPSILGLPSFRGQVFHSKYFENPSQFSNKSVMSIGFGPSSADLALILSKYAKTVTVCHKFPSGFKLGVLPKNVREIPNVQSVTETGIISENGEEVPCDVIIIGTGYGLKYPFLKEETSGISVISEKYIPHLYKMTVFTKRPTLAILNMVYRTAEIIMTEVQVKYFVSIMEGSHQLPSYEDMEKDVKLYEEEREAKNQPYGLWFQVGEFGFGAWEYFRGIAREMGRQVEEETCREWPLLEALLFIVFGMRIYGKLALYKKDRLRIVSKNRWELVLNPGEDEMMGGRKEKVVMTLDPVEGKVTTETVEIDASDDDGKNS